MTIDGTTHKPISVETRTHLGDITVTAPGIGLRAIGAASRVYAKLVAEAPLVTAMSPARPRRGIGYEFDTVIDEITDEAEDVRSLVLRRRDNAPLPSWLPGAHIDVTTPAGTERQYSLTGRPGRDDHYQISVRKIPDGKASNEIHSLEVGDSIRVRGPRNAFPMAEAEHYLFVAAGIGITPIRAMIERAAAEGARWTLYYHGRSVESMPFVAELERLAFSSRGRLVIKSDDVEGLPSLSEIVGYASGSSAMYVCGPVALTSALRVQARRTSTIAEFHAELFAPAPVVDGKPFTLQLAGSGETITVGAQETALDALRRTKPDQPYSCRQGFCGACVVGLVEGRVDHRDRVLSVDEKQNSLTLCVSRGAADGEVVVLDL
ncbi:PDR/VanB family oxidoreductase [Rhodococcus sp. I2R]|uniref:PDR/VanB family oxidoreductase n=1 Tax=Rhodococcus sp. I2R TaxID=2855445 RepID=UPI001E39442A|nr:PDR/VanB family oxidoreductase [Rhodococcus sp. I2R]